jgi:hypothetical protein
MEQQISHLARIFEAVLDTYETTGYLPAELVAEAQHSIMMARTPA